MRICNKRNIVCAGVVINGLSWNQLTVLNDCFKQLPQKVEILLIKHVADLPAVFYRLGDKGFAAEISAQAKRDLLCTAEAFDGRVMPYVFKGPRALQVLRVLPEIDYLIGDRLKPSWGIPSNAFVGSVRAFVSRYVQDDFQTKIASAQPTATQQAVLSPFYQPVVVPHRIESSACDQKTQNHPMGLR